MIKISNEKFMELVESYNYVNKLANSIVDSSLRELHYKEELISEFEQEWTFLLLRELECDIGIEKTEEMKKAYFYCKKVIR